MLEARHRVARTIGIEVLIEEIEALNSVEQIAAASPQAGGADLRHGRLRRRARACPSRTSAKPTTIRGDLYHYHRNRVAIAARLNGLDAIDGPLPTFATRRKYRDEARRAALLGFAGKWAIHPAQIELAEAIFTPDAARWPRRARWPTPTPKRWSAAKARSTSTA